MLQMKDILNAAPRGGLFDRGAAALPWRISPRPLALSKGLVRRLEGLGHILAKFQDASHALYLRSAAGRITPWLAALLDAGKPAWLINAQRSPALRHAAPRVIRPDLLLTGENTLALVELDSVPGGMGITLWLSRLYAAAGFPILGGAEGILQGMRTAHPDGACIAVSAESADYKPEMRWLAKELGSNFCYTDAEQLQPADAHRTIYRFWELFDTDNVPPARALCETAAAGGELQLSPPPIAHLEEKLWLALLHTPGLRHLWNSELRAAHLERLRSLIPYSWVVCPDPLPPQAALPRLELHSWNDVAALGRSARQLVLKVSGFSPLAWGSRGVIIGHDVSTPEWQSALSRALAEYHSHPRIMQEFHEACLVDHPYFGPDGTLHTLRGRVRLCPYYFRSPAGPVQLGGCLATITPADKKKIHGMSDAILVPCTLS